MRAALAWLFARGDGDAFMQIAGALELFWYWRGYWSEARRCLEQLLASQVPLSLAAMGTILFTFFFPIYLAHIAVARGQPLDAARLFGAAEVLRERIGFPIQASYATEYAHAVAAARAQWDADAFARAWAEGRAWTVEEILKL